MTHQIMEYKSREGTKDIRIQFSKALSKTFYETVFFISF